MDAKRFDEISRDPETNASVEQCVGLGDKLKRRLQDAVVEALTAISAYRPPASLSRQRRAAARVSHEEAPILTAVDRSKNHFDKVVDRREKAAIITSLVPLIEHGSIICSDGYPGYKELAVKTASDHHLIEFDTPTVEEKEAGLPRGREGTLTLGRVNYWHVLMKTRFNRIHRGVSTRYLPHYLTLLGNRYAEKLQP